MKYKYKGMQEFEGTFLESDTPREKWGFGTEILLIFDQPERLSPEDATSVSDSPNCEYK